MALTHEIVGDLPTLEALAPAWEALLAASARPHVMRGPSWLVPWWRVYGGPRAVLCVVALRRGRELVGVVPLWRRTLPAGARLGLGHLHLLGAGENEADEICSEYGGLVGAPGEEQSVVEAFVELLTGGALGAWHELEMGLLSSEDSTPGLLLEALKAVALAELDVTSGAPFARLSPTWEGYLGSLTPSRRQRARRRLRAFERWSGGGHVLRRASTEVDLGEGLAVLASLHEARWRAAGRSGAFASSRFHAFHRQVLPDLLRRQAVDLLWLVARGRPIAALYNLVSGGRVQFYQSGRAPDLERAVAPGSVLHLLAMKDAIARGRSEYDFLGGPSRHKLELSHDVRPMLRLRCRPRSALTRFRRAGALARSWRRALTG